MSIKRLIAILFMTAVLLGMFGFVAAMIMGVGFGTQKAISVMDGIAMEGGSNVDLPRLDLPGTYTMIEIMGPMNVEWIKDKKTGYQISGSEHLAHAIKCKMQGDKLTFYAEGKNTSGSAKITIYGPQPSNFVMAGSGDVELHDLSKGELSVNIIGSGNFDLNGEVNSLDAQVSGSGDIEASDLVCDSAKARVTGSGNLKLNVLKELTATVSGSGDITYKGDPPKVTKDVSGSGSVEKED